MRVLEVKDLERKEGRRRVREEEERVVEGGGRASTLLKKVEGCLRSLRGVAGKAREEERRRRKIELAANRTFMYKTMKERK